MRSDALLAFVPIGGNLSLVTGGANAVASTNVIDLMGVGVGVAPPNIIGNTALFGPDMGIGGFRPEIKCVLGTAFVGGTSLNVALQAAPDTAVTYQPGAWTTLAETGAMLTANLTAGQLVARFPWLPAFPANLSPRYLRMLFTPVGTYTAGTIASAIVTTVRDDQANKFAANNYKVA